MTDLDASVVPKVSSPWRRFFARELDFFLYSILWVMFCTLALNINLENHDANLKDTFAITLLMLLIEPLLLSAFGTTLGKWVLGLRVANNDGGRLSYAEALSRTWKVLLFGLGLSIPIFNLVRLWLSYRDCNDGDTLEWEYLSRLVLKDEGRWRSGAYIGAALILYGLAMCFAFITRGSNELLNESQVVSAPCEGVSLEVFADTRNLTYSISSEKTDYIVFDGFQRSFELEMLDDGKWNVVGSTRFYIDSPATISPANDFTSTIRWKDYYEYNLRKGQYRLIFTFWAMKDGEQSQNYNAIAEFMID